MSFDNIVKLNFTLEGVTKAQVGSRDVAVFLFLILSLK
jgi:hypothetical protein